MKHLIAPGIIIALIGCASKPVSEVAEHTPSKTQPVTHTEDLLLTKEVPRKDIRTIEPVPSELSIEHFKNMKLIGTDLNLHAVLQKNDAYTRYQISYLSNGLTISGIMNIPHGDGPYPLLILNHGYISPTVYTVGRGLKREQDYLARNGYAVLHTDYRGHGESDESPDTRMVYDAGLEYAMDSINAIHAVRAVALPSVDADRVGMLGHSLGGGVTLNIATAHPEVIDAIVLYAPVHSDAWENFLRWRDMRDEGDRTRAAMGTREEHPDVWNALSSLTHLQNIDDPVLLFHGTNDEDVPIEWSEFLHTKLEELGKQNRYVIYSGEKHEFIPKWNDFMQQTVEFLDTHLRDTKEHVSIYDESRMTKKVFGTFVTPENSPVSPERFSGYHTGIDFEVHPDEDETSISVPALCDGTVLFTGNVNGYGGVVVQACTVDGRPVTVLYGHLSASSVELNTGDSLLAGIMIGTIGKGFSMETEGERPHLHLSVHRGKSIEWRGYTEVEEELIDWIDPEILLNQ